MTTQYLEQYDATADADKFPLVYNWMWEEPLPFFKELREKRPILVTPVVTIISGMVQKRPILGNTDNSNPTRILRVSID